MEQLIMIAVFNYGKNQLLICTRSKKCLIFNSETAATREKFDLNASIEKKFRLRINSTVVCHNNICVKD